MGRSLWRRLYTHNVFFVTKLLQLWNYYLHCIYEVTVDNLPRAVRPSGKEYTWLQSCAPLNSNFYASLELPEVRTTLTIS